MGNRKFKMKGLDAIEAIKRFGLDEVILDLPDTKETYKTLSALAVDWDFYEEPEGEEVGDMEINEMPEEKSDPAKNETENLGSLDYLLTDFNKMATYIEAAYKLGKKSPEIIFGSNLWTEEMAKLYDEVGSSILTIDHTLLSTLLSSFYDHFLDPNNLHDRAEIVGDINKRLKEHWKEAPNHPSLISYIQILFKS